MAGKKKGRDVAACPHCAAREGQLHEWNCSHEQWNRKIKKRKGISVGQNPHFKENPEGT